MTDLFISYASEDRDHVAQLVVEFERQGWTVWWDRHIATGHSFDKGIEQAIDAALCIVVVWSNASVQSDWVRAEAGEGLERNILVPILLEPVKPPLLFRQKQAVNLVDWKADGGEHREPLERLMPSIATILESYRTSTIPVSTQRAWVLGKVLHTSGEANLAGAIHFAMSLGLSYLENLFLYDASFNETRVDELAPDQLQALVDDEGLNGYLYCELVPGTDGLNLVAHANASNGEASVHRIELGAAQDTYASRIADLLVELAPVLQGRPAAHADAMRNYLDGRPIDALAEYAASLALTQRNEYAAVKQQMHRCLAIDADFWPAWRGLAVACIYLGQEDEARAAIARAVKSIKHESDKNQHFARGVYHAIYSQDYDKAAEDFGAMLKLSPLDVAAINNLAVARYFQLRFSDAAELAERDLQLYPGKLLGRQNAAFYAMYANRLDDARAGAAGVVAENRAFFSSVVLQGLCLAQQGRRDAAIEIYTAFRNDSDAHEAVCAQAQADLALADGDTSTAIKLLDRGIELDTARANHEHHARKLLMRAEALAADGQLSNIASSLEVSKSIAHLLAVAAFCAEHGVAPPEVALRESRRKTTGLGRACARTLEALAAADDDTGTAIALLEDAQAALDLWLVHYAMGHVYHRADMLLEASDAAEVCVARYGEGLCATMDEQPSYRYLARARRLLD